MLVAKTLLIEIILLVRKISVPSEYYQKRLRLKEIYNNNNYILNHSQNAWEP